MAPRTDAVGTSECPIKGCTETVAVFKYREKSTDPTRRRFAGRLYCVCAKHGRIENQEFLLEHIKWNDASHAAASKSAADTRSPSAVPVTTVRVKLERPVARSVREASAPVRTPASAPVKRPAPAPVPKHEKTEKAVSSSSGGWLPEFWK